MQLVFEHLYTHVLSCYFAILFYNLKNCDVNQDMEKVLSTCIFFNETSYLYWKRILNLYSQSEYGMYPCIDT